MTWSWVTKTLHDTLHRECESPLPVQHSGPGYARGGQSLLRQLGAVQTRAAWVRQSHQQQQGRVSAGLSRKRRLE